MNSNDLTNLTILYYKSCQTSVNTTQDILLNSSPDNKGMNELEGLRRSGIIQLFRLLV